MPALSAASTIAPAMRSFTDAVGLKLSNLATISSLHPQALGRRFSRTMGVRPTRAVMSGAMAITDAALALPSSTPSSAHRRQSVDGLVNEP